MSHKTLMSARWLAVILVAAGCLVCLQNDRPRSVNEASRTALVQSLLEYREVSVDRSRFFNTVDIVERSGLHYSDKPPLLSLYSAALLKPLIPPMSFNSPAQTAILHRLSVLSLNGLLLLVLVAVLMRTLAGAPTASAQTGYHLILGTLMLVFLPAYSSHFAEAALTFCAGCAVAADRTRPRFFHAALAGVCAGLQWSLHPFSGSILILASALVFGWGRIRQGLIFLSASAAVVAAGLAAHQALYGTWKFFYFDPQGYLFLWGPKRQLLSTSFANPTNPGLTEARITARVYELGLPDAVLAQTLEHFRQFRAGVADPFRYAVRTFRQQDFLAVNPLVFAGLLVWARGAARSFRERWREQLWVAMIAGGIYAGTIVLRTQSGFSFGNRHLVPAVAVVMAGCWMSVDRERFRPLLGLAFFVSLPMMLPGLVGSWQVPSAPFLAVNLWITLAMYGLILAWVLIPACEKFLSAVWSSIENIKWIYIFGLLSLAAAEFKLSFAGREVRWAELWIAMTLICVVSGIKIFSDRKDPNRIF